MSYAVRKDGKGWRAVASAEDIDMETEIWQAEQPPVVEQPEVVTVTASQLRIALSRMGKLAQVEAWADSQSDTVRRRGSTLRLSVLMQASFQQRHRRLALLRIG